MSDLPFFRDLLGGCRDDTDSDGSAMADPYTGRIGRGEASLAILRKRLTIRASRFAERLENPAPFDRGSGWCWDQTSRKTVRGKFLKNNLYMFCSKEQSIRMGELLEIRKDMS